MNPKTEAEERVSGSAENSQGKAPPGQTRKAAVLEKLRSIQAGDDAGGLQELDLRGIDLIGEDLSGINFSGCDLSGAELSRANLSRANFSWCQLKGTALYQAQLSRCEFLGADLGGADLSECTASRAGFGGATLEGTVFTNANLKGATLSKAKLRDADFSTANLQGARIREADLSNTIFRRADLRETDLEKSNVSHTVFDGTDLREARLKGISLFHMASWIGADIRNVDFTGAYMVRRFIMDQNYLYEFRTRNRITNIIYKLWWITSDCGRSLSRWAGWTLLVALVFASLFALVDVDYGEHQTFLSPIYYSVVTLTTLGYGDAVPASAPAQVLAMFEVAVGYLVLGGLLSIFANKMSRRAD